MIDTPEFTLFDPGSFRVPERKVVRIFIHNTGWDNIAFGGPDLVHEINRWHAAEGWGCIGFHYVIDKAGFITTGRPMDVEPMEHPGKRGKKAIDIAVQGLWHFTEPQMRSLQVLCKSIADAYELDRQSVSFHGLCEIAHVPNPMIDYGKLLHLDGSGHIGELDPAIAKDVADRASFLIPVAGNA